MTTTPTTPDTDPQHPQTSLVGYARVSTADQDPSAQISSLHEAGCHRVFTDHASGTHADRPQLKAAMDYLRSGDTLVVWRLDRLGRSLPHLLDLVEQLGGRGIEFRSLTEAIDTTTPTGRLIFHIAGAFSQFERDLISERTKVGLAEAAAAGRRGGRPRVITDDKQQALETMHAAGSSPASIAAALGVSRTTVRRTLGTR